MQATEAIEGHQAEPIKKTHVVTALKYPLPSPYVSFERHFEILKAFVAASKEGKEPVSYRDFGRLTVAPTAVSGNNKFFEHLNLITKAGGTTKYVPTADAIEICKDLAWKKEDKVKSRLGKLVSASWFGESARKLLTIRGKVAENDLVEQLSYDSGADPRKHTPSLKVLAEYLKFSGLLRTENGFLTLPNVEPPSAEPNDISSSVAPAPSIDAERADTRSSFRGVNPAIVVGVLVTPESSEEQMRKAVRILLEEIQKR